MRPEVGTVGLASFAQNTVPDVMTIPDFFDQGDGTAASVYCDGSMHDEPQQQASDEAIRRELKARGYRIVVIRHDRNSEEQVQERMDIFGEESA